MRCHYDVLGVSLTATNDEIKKAYRKNALMWHPDKHSDSDEKTREDANKKFLEIQDAYETLMDSNDRAWYDSHREVLINGGNPGEPGEANYMFNIFPFFSATCFKGFGDDERSFYSVYRDMFATLAEEDKQFYDEEIVIPEFGESASSYEEVVAPFYSFWMGYCTPRSFVWCEKHDIREAGDRYVRRIMEKENKKLIDKAKKERNEEIRKLVETVRKRDKRVIEYKKIMEEKTLAAQKKAQEKRDAERLKKIQEMKAYVEPEWSSVGKKLQKLHLAEEILSNEEDDNLMDSDEYDDFDESLFCVACDKSFKNEKSKENHEKSKRHKENIALLKQHMMEEEDQVNSSKNSSNSSDPVEEEINEEVSDEDDQNSTIKQKLSKKDKKKRKNKQAFLQNLEDNPSDAEADLEVKDSSIQESEAPENNEATSVEQMTDQKAEEETHPTKSKKSKKDKKGKKAQDEKAADVVDEEQSLTCTVCSMEFESRNKLFSHIEQEGHAQATPLSYNQIKKNRILLSKLKKNKK